MRVIFLIIVRLCVRTWDMELMLINRIDETLDIVVANLNFSYTLFTHFYLLSEEMQVAQLTNLY